MAVSPTAPPTAPPTASSTAPPTDRRVHRAGGAARAALVALLTAATLLLPTTASTAATAPTPAHAPAPAATSASARSTTNGTFQEVTGFGSNPGNLAMYTYTPAALPGGAPLVVALHGCTQTADDYYRHSGWPELADRYRFAVVFPQTGTTNNPLSCFRWFDAAQNARGVGEAASVLQMVTRAGDLFGTDRGRVFVTGLSAGGGMAADLLADYPDVFAGGAVDAGPPAHCAATLSAASSCQNNDQRLTPAQWAEKVRRADPGHPGPWPRVAIWQGTADTTVRPVNATELRDQWTEVWGIGQSPSGTRSLPGGTTETRYDDAGGRPAVALYSIAGMGHGLAVAPGSGADRCGATGAYFLDAICSGYHTALFWGLDGGGPTVPGLPAPSGLTATVTGGDTVALGWQPVTGAASYRVFRDGAPVADPTGTTWTDSGLSAGTAYGYAVAAVSADGTAGTRSAAVTVTAPGGPAPCYTTDNYHQVAAGRATLSGGLVYALGSGQAMGLWNTFTVHTLRRTGPGYYVLADGSC
ncbi:esterase, PHB depolymerase family [Streptomyces sp. TLI_053]|uniref:extracellular catalytic domain type 1 short-chain-length polyhydroxyalkanoate depolymerase n=1 Tax=Streptomyces sp. TLI_053 TaxID=1855352 RepID=UPI00087A69A9|nr:PHB depolymerase family esterase [Streptomyces sp. TLI_053]SDT82410.1 esterase, PHB depolymerase family [Streptomyces sp. TLI_053]